MSESLDLIYDKVKHILRDFPETRDSTSALVLRYWNFYDGGTKNGYDRLTPPDSITRMRRRIQNEDGHYLPSTQTQKLRDERQSEYEAWSKENKLY